MSNAKTAAWVAVAGSSLALALSLRAKPTAAAIPFPDGYRRCHSKASRDSVWTEFLF